MEKRWYAVWEPGIPRVFEPEKSLPEYFRNKVKEVPDNKALSFYGYDMTYKELNNAIDRFAGGLEKLGVKKGDRVALFMQNCPQFIISYFGALLAGTIVVSLNPMFKHAELEYEIKDSGAETLVSLDILYPEIEKIKDKVSLRNIIVTTLRDYLPEKPSLPLPPEAEKPVMTFSGVLEFTEFLRKSPLKIKCGVTDLKKDLALLQYTGGTTGLPKGAMITHHTLAHNTIASTLKFSFTPADIHLNVSPNFHIMGMLQSMCAPLASGGHQIILSRFTPEAIALSITQYKCTVWQTTTTAIIAMLNWPEMDNYDFSSLRLLWYGGATMPTEIVTRLRKVAPKAIFGEGYSLTESCSTAGALTPVGRLKMGYIGIPCISTEMKIVDLETGLKDLEPGEEGEILIKGPGIMKGYWNKPEETKEVLRNGWLHTGDIGKMDEEGYITVLGRTKELIKCSGYSVFPTEVEELLYRHPAIAEVAVIGVPDPYRGQATKAFIVPRPEYKGKVTEKDIEEWTKDNMATYKRPRIIEFRDTLPKSAAGKIMRRILSDEDKGKGR